MRYLVSGSPYNNHDGYELADVLCKQFCVEYPKELLGILHCCICETVEKQRKVAIMGFQQLKSSIGLTQKIIM